MAKQEKMTECVVVRSGLIIGNELAVGDKICLTDKQMQAFVGKVKSTQAVLDSENNSMPDLKGLKLLRAELEASENTVNQLQAELEASTTLVDSLKAELAKLQSKK